MKKHYLLPLLFILFTNRANAQAIEKVADSAAAGFMASGPRVGVAVGIFKNDTVYSFYYGNTVKGANSKPNALTIYEIGSVTKTFTSLLLAQAVSQKRASLNDDIRKYLAGAYPNLSYQGKPILLRHLVNLTSGLPNNLPEKMPASTVTNPDAQLLEFQKYHNSYTRQQFLKDLHGVKLNAEPGKNTAHSNTAAQLLGFILENIYGDSYENLLKKQIFSPLKMSSTYVGVSDAFKQRYATGYNQKGMAMPEIPKDAGSAGVLTATLPDMLNYLQFQLHEKSAAVVLCHQPLFGQMENFAVGANWFMKTNFDGKRKLWASGGTFGFASYMVLYPERGFGIVLLSNENDNSAEDALSNLAQTIYNELYFTPAQRGAEAFGFSAAINKLDDALNKNGFGDAIAVANHLLNSNPGFKLDEDELNSFGYKLLGTNKKKEGLAIFKLIVSQHPQSANAYDSLAEAFADLGDQKAAIMNYKRSLELNPGNTNAAEQLKKLGAQN